MVSIHQRMLVTQGCKQVWQLSFSFQTYKKKENPLTSVLLWYISNLELCTVTFKKMRSGFFHFWFHVATLFLGGFVSYNYTQTHPRSQQWSGVKLKVHRALPWTGRSAEWRESSGSGTWPHQNLQIWYQIFPSVARVGMRWSLQSFLTQTPSVVLWYMLHAYRWWALHGCQYSLWYLMTNLAALFE